MFEEKLQEIDRDIGIFDPIPKLSSKNIQATDKEIFLESLSITDVEKDKIQALPCQPRLPLSVLPDTLNIPGSNEGTWKRIPRSCVKIDVIIEEAVGTKIPTRHADGHSELQKKKISFSDGQ
ncbi:hypothetical protein ACB092_05G172300 [Castanea dentata]